MSSHHSPDNVSRSQPLHRRRGPVASSRGRTVRVFVVIAALLMVGLVTLEGSRAAFTATTTNGVNNFAAGTVVLSDDDAGGVMFNLANMAPGTTTTRCINVTYTGSLTSDVKLYGVVGGSGLATYLDTVITVGTGAAGGAGFGCAGFTPTSVLHSNTLANFGATYTNYGNGLAGFAGATNPTTRSYQVAVTVQNNNAAQGLNASATFTWEAQNV